MLFAVVFSGARGEGKPRKGRSLGKDACDRICVQMMECAGMPHENATVVEALICSDDCVTESKDAERRPGWLCASRATDCDALKACNAGSKTGPAK